MNVDLWDNSLSQILVCCSGKSFLIIQSEGGGGEEGEKGIEGGREQEGRRMEARERIEGTQI